MIPLPAEAQAMKAPMVAQMTTMTVTLMSTNVELTTKALVFVINKFT